MKYYICMIRVRIAGSANKRSYEPGTAMRDWLTEGNPSNHSQCFPEGIPIPAGVELGMILHFWDHEKASQTNLFYENRYTSLRK